MLSNDFAALLAPFKLLTNKNALSATYRSLELNEKCVRGCAGFGIMEVYADFGLPPGPPIYVDATSFIAVLDSLPDDKDVQLTLAEGAVLNWECGAARGKLATTKITEMPKISHANDPEAWRPTAEFIASLKLGMLSCGNESLASIGMYGVVIDKTEDLCIYASDNVTVSVAYMAEPPAMLKGPATLTFSPDACRLLAAVIDPDTEKARIEFEEQGLYYRDGTYRLLLKQLAPIKEDITRILIEYSAAETTVALPIERVQAFIKRINALSENKKSNHITIQASAGKMTMSFSDGLASSEEYYLVDELVVPDLPAIKLDALKLGRALASCDTIVLDHIERKVVVLQGGAAPIFQYIISGKQ